MSVELCVASLGEKSPESAIIERKVLAHSLQAL